MLVASSGSLFRENQNEEAHAFNCYFSILRQLKNFYRMHLENNKTEKKHNILKGQREPIRYLNQISWAKVFNKYQEFQASSITIRNSIAQDVFFLFENI